MPLISLPSKPQAQIAYDISSPKEGDEQEPTLVVFISGLGLPAASWKPVISIIQASNRANKPQMLTYDRFGQGATTARDPLDEQPGREPGYGHDFLDATKDLYELLQALVPPSPKPRRLVLVAASVGVHLAHLWPDAHAPGFDPKEVVADDCTLEQYLEASAKIPKMFNSDVKNPEGLDRRDVKTLLPEPGAPKLIGPDGRGLWLTVVGHDPEAFADESLRMKKIPSLNMRFSNPAWNEYNEGLLGLTDAERARGVVIASGCGHFIHKDDPEFVATQLKELLDRAMSKS